MLVNGGIDDWFAPYGAMLAVAFFAAWLVARRRATAGGVDPSHIDCLLPLTLAAGLAAAPLLALVLPDERWLAGEALSVHARLRLPSLLVAAGAVFFLYCRVARLPCRRLADVLAPAVLLALAILRLGCFLGGCCFGDVAGHADRVAAITDPQVRYQVQSLPALSAPALPWAVQFPAGSPAYQQHLSLGLIGEADRSSLPVHPVQLYEAFGALALVGMLLRLERRRLAPGTLAVAATAGYAFVSLFVHFVRADNAMVVGPLGSGQVFYLSLLAVMAALGGIQAMRRPGTEPVRGAAEP